MNLETLVSYTKTKHKNTEKKQKNKKDEEEQWNTNQTPTTLLNRKIEREEKKNVSNNI